jgi:DNA-binding MurR/RpiR family transcriptional regulator
MENIAETFKELDQETLSRAVEGIASARRVVFVGMRNGYFLAKYLRWQVSEIRPDTELLPSGGETMGEALADLTDNDVLVIFAVRRLVPAVRAVVAVASTLRCRTLIIADRYFSEPVRPTWLLTCSTRCQAPLDNHVAILLLCHVIADELIQLLGPKGRKRLATIEDIHDLLGEI